VARAVLLATGCRERPRAARLVPGTRPLGVLTTATLQQLVHLQHCRVGRRAVVVGAEHVSFSALLTLAEAGVHPVAMVTEHPRHQTYAPLAWATATRLRVPILAASRVTRIVGRERVEAVEVTELGSGAVRRLACDTVVFTGDWIPDHELARRGGLVLDPATRAPRVDQSCRTSTAGVFAAGNLVHAAETADVAALGGRHAARAIAAFLRDETWPAEPTPVTCDAPLLWVSPSALVAAPPVLPRGRFLFRVGAFAGPATLVVEQDSHPLWRKRYRRLAPNASLAARVGWLSGFDPARGPLRFRLDGARAETHVSGRDQTREWKAR
jgi:pyruvate/2-oxoglutarate dehydrogenase complex dihydrolipoamide dehydrogenase (E3) component